VARTRKGVWPYKGTCRTFFYSPTGCTTPPCLIAREPDLWADRDGSRARCFRHRVAARKRSVWPRLLLTRDHVRGRTREATTAQTTRKFWGGAHAGACRRTGVVLGQRRKQPAARQPVASSPAERDHAQRHRRGASRSGASWWNWIDQPRFPTGPPSRMDSRWQLPLPSELGSGAPRGYAHHPPRRHPRRGRGLHTRRVLVGLAVGSKTSPAAVIHGSSRRFLECPLRGQSASSQRAVRVDAPRTESRPCKRPPRPRPPRVAAPRRPSATTSELRRNAKRGLSSPYGGVA